MDNPDIAELVFFIGQNVLMLLGTFSVVAKVTPWDDEKLNKELKQNPSKGKLFIKKLLWVINALGLAKRIK